MNKVKIKCPSCSKTGTIEISPNILKNSIRGLLAINIARDIICPHSFIAYIDKNLSVRDYFVADFRVELPQMTTEEISKADKIPSRDIVDIDLIKLNIPAILLTYILKSIFLKQRIVIINDQEFLHHHIHNFFKYITQNSFETNIILMTEETYNKNKKTYKDSMIFDNIHILRNVKKLINPKKLFIEKQIVSRFVIEFDLEYSYIILKNDILKAFEFSKEITDFIKDYKEKNESINILEISAQLEKKYNTKISRIYLDFLIDIVINYFEVACPSYSDSFISSF
ncbi:MAG: hypothetical protein ACFFAH_09390 [Promethearchaeota archaeon]